MSVKVFSQCASCGKGIEGGDNVYICKNRVYCCKECFAKSKIVSNELHCLVEKYLSGFEKILDEDVNAEPLFILEEHEEHKDIVHDVHKICDDWMCDESFGSSWMDRMNTFLSMSRKLKELAKHCADKAMEF